MKNKMSKIAFVVLSFAFVLSTCMTVFALTSLSVSNSQNGIEATLNFNKQEYNANEEVEVTLNVKNNNSYAVKNIQTELIVPSTIKLSKGSLKQGTFSLNAGESKVQEVVLEKVVETSNEPTTNNPQTGDNIVVHIAMLVISVGGLVVIAVKKKWIHKKKVMSLVLCFTLVGAMTLTSVVNADVAAKEFTVEGTIKYDGEDVVIKGKVTYDYEVYSKVQIDGVDKGMYAEGNTVNIIAEDAPEGKHFAGWTVVKGNVTLADANSSTTTFVMGKEDVEIKSNYEVNTYTITSSANEGGTITESATVNYGDSKTFKITPNTGYKVKEVMIDDVSIGAKTSYEFKNITADHTIDVTFTIQTFTITASVNNSSMGTITETTNVNYGGSKTFTMTANTGYGVKDVKVDGTSVGPVTSYTFENVNENHKIEVEFDTATTVTTAQQFRDAVTKDGIVILANDITLDDNEDVEITGNIIIHGNDYIINLPTADNVIFSGSDSTFMLVNCHFVGDNYIIMKELWIAIYNSVFDNNVKLDASAVLYIHDSTFVDLSWDGKANVIVLGGVLGKAVGENLNYAVSSGVRVYFRIYSGTIYFDPTNYIDTDKYKATKTKDADNVDIWVVTKK